MAVSWRELAGRLLPFVAEPAGEEQKRYEQVQKLLHGDLFGKRGALVNCSPESQKDFLELVSNYFEERTEAAIKYIERSKEERRKQCDSYWHESGLDWGDVSVSTRLKHFLDAAKNGIFLPDWKERLAKIEKGTHHYFGNFSGRVINDEREEIENTAVKIEKLLGKVPAGIKGSGLEFLRSDTGGSKRVYLDGQCIASVANGHFSESPTNGEVVAWVVNERIDHCIMKGNQVRWRVLAWKKGFKEPKEVFEDHAYDAERSLYIRAPEVTKEGEVTFDVVINDEASTKRVSLGSK